MDLKLLLVLWTCTVSPDLLLCFNFDMKNFRIFSGPKDSQFGYTVQQHESGGRQWLLVGAPFESTGDQQTGDIYKCPLDTRDSENCSRLNLGRLSLENVSERKEKMRLGMTLTSNPKDSSFVTCGPLWSHECGSSLYSTGICAKSSRNFRLTSTIAPAHQRCETFMDIVIVLDGSNSIYPWYEVQDFLINILQKFYIGPGQTQVGVVQYSSSVVHEFNLGDYQTVEEVVEAARTIDQRGGEETRTALGINVARSEAFQRGGRPGAQKVMIVITDGESHDSPQLLEAVRDSQEENVTMYAIAVLGYYNRRGINPEAFLKEIKFIASDPDEKHFFEVTDETALKNIVDALGERIFSLEGTSSQGQGFGLQMAQAGFSSHFVKDGVLLGAVGAFEWNGAVLKQTKYGGKVIPPRSSYQDEFPESLKNHAAYLGYSVGSLVSSRGVQLYVAGAPRFNHTGKVIVFSLKNSGNLTILHALLGEQIGSYFGGELLSMDIDSDGHTDFLLVSAPMFYSQGWEKGRVYIYALTPQTSFVLQGVLESDRPQNSRLGSALAQIADMNGDGFRELVVGAPLEDDHQGAIYIYYSQERAIQLHYKQRLPAAGFSPGLRYFGQSLHGVLDINADGLVDLAVGAMGAAVIIWSRDVVQIHGQLTFEPQKVDVFNGGCQRGGRMVACMSVRVCLSLKTSTNISTEAVAVLFSLLLDEHRSPGRAVLDEADRLQPRRVSLRPGDQSCQRLQFHVQENSYYGRPIVVLLQTWIQDQDQGPVLDPDWPSSWRAQLDFWNGCEREDVCRPDLVLKTHSDLTSVHRFCLSGGRPPPPLAPPLPAPPPLCPPRAPGFLVEPGRRRLTVSVLLENRGENAFRTGLLIHSSPNLHFSRLLQDQTEVQMECHTENRRGTQRICNISAPFMKALSKVTFNVEFEFNHSTFLDHAQVILEATSEGEENQPDDNINDIFLPLKYQTDLLFTRDPNPRRFEIQSHPPPRPGPPDPTFNLTYNIQNLGIFPVPDILFRVDIWAVTRGGNQLLDITDYRTDQDGSESLCTLPPKITSTVKPEDLTHLSQMNLSNSQSLGVLCRLSLGGSRGVELTLTLTGRLRMPTLHTVGFRSLQLLAVGSVQLETSSPAFLPEPRLLRETLLDLRRQQLVSVPVWIILGSSLGGFLLLLLLVLLLWKIGFFRRRRRQEEEEEEEEQ
ncbi:LOW QUALITY PROTEIN: integrin alpha-11 [Menidia menidia]